jgi:hypothetical protein
MGRGGRFGKYGEYKRLERLRQKRPSVLLSKIESKNLERKPSGKKRR